MFWRFSPVTFHFKCFPPAWEATVTRAAENQSKKQKARSVYKATFPKPVCILLIPSVSWNLRPCLTEVNFDEETSGTLFHEGNHKKDKLMNSRRSKMSKTGHFINFVKLTSLTFSWSHCLVSKNDLLFLIKFHITPMHNSLLFGAATRDFIGKLTNSIPCYPQRELFSAERDA